MTPSEYAELLRLRDLARFLIRTIDGHPDHQYDEPLTERELALADNAAQRLHVARGVLNKEAGND